MNTYIQLLELIIRNAPNENNLIFEPIIDEINTLIYNLSVYGSPKEKYDFMTLMINDIDNNGIGLAYLVSRLHLILNNTDFMLLTDHVFQLISNEQPNNYLTYNIQKIDCKYPISTLISDIDANMYFNLMQVVSHNIDLETKVFVVNIILNGLIDITTKNPSFSYLVSDTCIERYIDSYFLLGYKPIVKYILERFLFLMKLTKDIQASIKTIIQEINVDQQKLTDFNYVLSITANDIQYKTGASIEFYVIFNMIVTIMADTYVLNILNYCVLPDLALFLMNNRAIIPYLSK